MGHTKFVCVCGCYTEYECESNERYLHANKCSKCQGKYSYILKKCFNTSGKNVCPVCLLTTKVVAADKKAADKKAAAVAVDKKAAAVSADKKAAAVAADKEAAAVVADKKANEIKNTKDSIIVAEAAVVDKKKKVIKVHSKEKKSELVSEEKTTKRTRGFEL